jgi:hypothetical protein
MGNRNIIVGINKHNFKHLDLKQFSDMIFVDRKYFLQHTDHVMALAKLTEKAKRWGRLWEPTSTKVRKSRRVNNK